MNTKPAKNPKNEELLIVLNPCKDDISLLGQHIRFTLMVELKQGYVWPFSGGNQAAVSIGLKLKDSCSCPELFRGAAVLKKGMYRFAASDFLSSFWKYPGEDDRELLVKMFSMDWSRVDEYISISPYL
jgi:hypothetical protein